MNISVIPVAKKRDPNHGP